MFAELVKHLIAKKNLIFTGCAFVTYQYPQAALLAIENLHDKLKLPNVRSIILYFLFCVFLYTFMVIIVPKLFQNFWSSPQTHCKYASRRHRWSVKINYSLVIINFIRERCMIPHYILFLDKCTQVCYQRQLMNKICTICSSYLEI